MKSHYRSGQITSGEKPYGRLPIWLFVSLILWSGCTTTRWVVDEPRYLDRQPDDPKTGELYSVELEHDVTTETPYLTFQLYRMDQFEVIERVRMERRLQSYSPTWGFAALASVGAAISFYAGSRSGLTGLTTRQQSLAFHAMGGLLSLATVAHLAPQGDAISTDEFQSLRGRSGRAVVADTVQASMAPQAYPVEIELEYDGETLYFGRVEASSVGRWVLELPEQLRGRLITGEEPGFLLLRMEQSSGDRTLEIPISSFLQPVVHVQTEATDLFQSPGEGGVLTTVAGGSEFPLASSENPDWYQVRFGGSLVYVASEEASVQWRRAQSISEPTAIPAGEVPFGQISVEFGLPEIVPYSTSDAAILLHNHRGNLHGFRRFTDRDLQMVELYFRDSFGVTEDRLMELDLVQSSPEEISGDYSGERLHLWISGFARIVMLEGESVIELVSMDEAGNEKIHRLDHLLREMASRSGESMIAYIDLTYLDAEEFPLGGVGESLPGELYNSISDIQPEAVLIFSTRPGEPDGRYESLRFENRYHHIFAYHLAEGWKQELTRLDRLVDHVQRQVDYTSRRLHDRSQRVMASGRLEIDLRRE